MSPLIKKGKNQRKNTKNKSYESSHRMRQLNHSVSLFDVNSRKNKAVALPDISLRCPDINTLINEKKNVKNFLASL